MFDKFMIILMQAVGFIATPFVSIVSLSSAAVKWAFVAPLFMVTTLGRLASFTCIFVVVANSALPADRSAVNGIGQAAVSAVRAVMPPLCTALFAHSVRTPNAPWPFNWHVVWYGLAAASIALFYLTRRLPTWIEMKRTA